MLRLCVFLSLLSTCLTAQPKPIGAQASAEKPAAKKPLALTEIQDLLKGSVTPKRVATLVEQYGVSFELTDDIEKELRKLGADDRLLLVIAKKHVQPVPNVTPQSASTWTDPATGLMWAKESNSRDVIWSQAENYCRSLHLGGHSNWGLPTIDELDAIFDPTQDVNGYHIKGGIKLSACCPWSSSAGGRNEGVWYFNFLNGKRYSLVLAISSNGRALCVRRPGE
jgi:hypothetical protein